MWCKETVKGNMVVKGFAGQDYEQQRFHESSMENLRRGLKMVVVQQLNSPVVQLIMSISLAIIMFIALAPEDFA